MDQKIATLSALCFLDDDQKPIPYETVRQLRIILSLYSQEILSEDEYEHLVDSLEEDGYIARRDNGIQVGREGAALVHAVSEQILGETAFARLDRMLGDYRKGTSAYIQKVNKQLKALQETREDKTKEIDKSLIRVVGIIVEIEHKYVDLHISSFELGQQIMRSEATLDSEINYSARRLTKETGYPIIAHRSGNTLQLISLVEVPSFAVFNQEVRASATETVRRENVSGWNLLLTSEFMEASLGELGYLRSRWPGRTFTKYQDFEQARTNIGCLRECESLNLDYTELQSDQVLVWVESFTSPTKRVLDFLKENLSDLGDKQEIQNCLSGLKLRSIPSGSEVELKDILPSRDLTSDQVPTTGWDYMSYWERTHGIELTEKVQPILVIQGFDGDFHYPAEMVYIDKFSLEERLGKSQKRKPKTESPRDRYGKIHELFLGIKGSQFGNLAQYLRIRPHRCVPTVEELWQLGAFKNAIRIRPPMLEFYGGAASLDPLDIFTPAFVPACGRKSISITHLVLPNDKTDADVATFLQEMQRMFSFYGFGKLQRADNLETVRYMVAEGKQGLESKLRNLSKATQTGENIAIAIVPDNDDQSYYALKRLLPINAGTPLQCVHLSTFEDILSRRFRGFQYLCLKILIKTLKEGESIWNLSSAAGLSQERTLFVGIAFSRYPREGKVSKCATVLHDARGDRVSWKVFATPQERTVTRQWFDTLLRRIRDIIEKERPSRLVFYRTGTLYPQEADAIRESLGGCSWLSSIRATFVSIIDSGNFRFYLYHRDRGRYQNLPAGYAIIVDEKEALLSSSNYDDRELRAGTIVPVRLKLEIGDENIVDVVKEYHDLTYLNWQAPTTTTKHPLVITISERFAELTREGVSAESMFYLDL